MDYRFSTLVIFINIKYKIINLSINQSATITNTINVFPNITTEYIVLYIFLRYYCTRKWYVIFEKKMERNLLPSGSSKKSGASIFMIGTAKIAYSSIAYVNSSRTYPNGVSNRAPPMCIPPGFFCLSCISIGDVHPRRYVDKSAGTFGNSGFADLRRATSKWNMLL